ncbi:MAG: hypothetical protein ACI8WB_000437 [Phenylobacterium sp.]|jgi:hypothetical protein
MIILAVAAIALLIILFFYFRTQTLGRELAACRRQISLLTSDVKSVEGVTEALAFEQQILFRKSIARAKQFGPPENDLFKYTEILVDAMVKVTHESAKGHQNVVEAFKKQLSRATDVSYSDFQAFISEQDDNIKTEWHKKTVVDYFTVCQLLINKIDGIPVEESAAE